MFTRYTGPAPAPPVAGYGVALKSGTEDATKWQGKAGDGAYQSMPLTGLEAGTAVSVKYSGTKRVKSVKAKKKVVVEGHALSASAVGDIVGSDGKAYAVADKDNLPIGVTAVAMVASKNGSNGLAIQLNASPVSKEWDEAKTYAEGLVAVPGGTWRLPSKTDWQNMFIGCAITGDITGTPDYMSPIAGFKEKIGATGTAWQSGNYWSSTPSGSLAWYLYVNLNDNNASAVFYQKGTSLSSWVLGCLAF